MNTNKQRDLSHATRANPVVGYMGSPLVKQRAIFVDNKMTAALHSAYE